MRSYTKKESEIRIIPEEKGVTSGFNIVNAKALGDESAEIEIAGITWINELGRDGNFEKDSNGDGFSDLLALPIYGCTAEIIYGGVFGNVCQRVTSSTTNRNINIKNRSVNANQKYYISCFVKTDILSDILPGIIATGLGVGWRKISPSKTNEWERLSMTFKPTEKGEMSALGLYISGTNSSGATVNINFDSFQKINLTQMGSLPISLVNYLNAKYTPTTAWVNFEDLSKEALDEIIPEYVDSVATVGYKFGQDSAEVVVNKGRNLWEWQIDSMNNWDNLERYPDLYEKDGYFYLTATGNNQSIRPTTGEYYGVSTSIVKLKPNTVYTLSCDAQNFGFVINISLVAKTSSANRISRTFTTDATGKIKIYFYCSTYVGNAYFGNIQLEEGTTATEYQPPKSYEEPLPEMWSMFGVSDETDSKKFKRVKLVDAIQSDGSVDWSWHTGVPSECLLMNIQKDSPNYGENKFLRMGNTSFVGWREYDDVMCVFVEHYLGFGDTNTLVDCGTITGEVDKIKIIFYTDEDITDSGSIRLLFVLNGRRFYYGNNITSAASNETMWMCDDSGASYIKQKLLKGWHTLELKWDGKKYSFTIDGISVETFTYLSPSKFINPRLILGAAGGYYLKGNITYFKMESTTNTLVEYKFLETDRILKDYTGNNGGTIYGATWHDTEFDNTVETYSTRAVLEFDGVDDYIDLDENISVVGNLTQGTVEITFEASRDYDMVFSASDSTRASSDISLDTHRFMIRGNDENNWIQDFPELVTNEKMTLSWVSDGTTNKIYKNGVLFAEDLNGGFFDSVNNLNTLRLGIRQDNGGMEYPLTGTLFDFRVWNIPLSQAALGAELAGDETGLLIWHSCKEGSGNILIDHSGNGNNGTIHGATWTKALVSKPSEVIGLPKNSNKILLSKGHNNIICDGAFISITHTKESDTSELLGFAEGFKATDSKNYFEYQPVNFKTKKRIETSRGYKITIDDLYLDASWDKRFEDGSFTIEVRDVNADEDKTIITKYHGCQIDSLSRDEGDYIKRGVEITAQTKEVTEE